MDAQDTPNPDGGERTRPFPQIPGGRYHIVERLSGGAIGGVFKALDTILDRPVAVKYVHLDTPFADHSPDELRERFVREARIAARLQHPNIVTIHDIVATEGHGFIIMEFIEGQSLEAFLARRKRLPLNETVRVITQLASALDYAHSRNVVHRDVKPTNIIVSDSLWVWVADFGIAKSELSTNLTMAGGVLGTPDYMSPEQAKGEDVDARSDLFSLGCVLFECATGEKPFRSPSLTGVLLSIINDEPVFPLNWRSLGLPNGLKPVLHHSLEKDRKNRYPSGADMVLALAGVSAELRTQPSVAALKETPEAPESAQEIDALIDTVVVEAAVPAAESKESDAPPEPMVVQEESSDAREAIVAEPPAEEKESLVASDDLPDAVESVAEAPAPPSDAVEKAPATEASAEDNEDSDLSPEHTVIFAAPPVAAPEPSAALEVDPAQLSSLKEETRPLRLSPSLSGDLQRAIISPEEGFLLSRIDGHSRASDILAMSPMSEAETAAALLNLLEKELIQFGGRVSTPPPQPSVPKGTPDENVVQELDRLLALAKAEEYAELLGIAHDAPASARKSAYLKIIGKYHPDKFPRATDEIREKLSTLCAEAAEATDNLASRRAVAPSKTNQSNGSTPGYQFSTKAPVSDASSSFDRGRYARELYDRALRAFDADDYWEAIQLCRQVLEVDDTQADYFNLLGRALMQNKKWRKEAAENFRKASDLEPGNIGYLGMLGAIYKAEGLQARATAVLKKAQTLDPAYVLPEIDGEVAVEAD